MKNQSGKIGLALGGGAARGWSHIGVIRKLEELGVPIDIVCGTSIGSLVGGAYAMGKLDILERWVNDLEWHDIPAFFDFKLKGGLIEGKKLFDFFHKHVGNIDIQELHLPFSAVAMDLDSGHEVWLREGPLFEAVRASISLPGLFNPTYCQNRWLVDGGMVNPVPVSLCRAMGAETVIAVELTPFAQFGTRIIESTQNPVPDKKDGSWWEKARSLTQGIWGNDLKKKLLESTSGEHPAYMDVVSQSVSIMQARITRSRLAVEPPDYLITPRVEKTGFMEFHRAKELIEIGKKAVLEMENSPRFLLNPPAGRIEK